MISPLIFIKIVNSMLNSDDVSLLCVSLFHIGFADQINQSIKQMTAV